MKVVCGWCQAVIVDGQPPVSHGICKPCERLHFPLDSGASSPDITSTPTQVGAKCQARTE